MSSWIAADGRPYATSALSGEFSVIDLRDEAPAPEPAAAPETIRRPNRQGVGGVLSPLTTVQPCNRSLLGQSAKR
jgi:hypothetical protein